MEAYIKQHHSPVSFNDIEVNVLLETSTVAVSASLGACLQYTDSLPALRPHIDNGPFY